MSDFQEMAKNFQTFSEREVTLAAKKIVANKEALAQHLFRTQKCRHGIRCNRKETCVGAHFANEYRVNICLHLQYCNRPECEKYHPNLGSVDGYLIAFGIKFEYKSKEEWIAATSKKPYPVVSMASSSSSSSGSSMTPAPSVLEEPNAKRQRTFVQGTFARTFAHSHPNLAPLTNAHKINRSAVQVDHRINTRLCSKMTEGSPCQYHGCTYAHSIDQLVLRKCEHQGCECKALHGGEEKIKAVERIFGPVQEFMKRETRFNNVKEMAAFQAKIKEQENFHNLIEDQTEVGSICEMMSKTKIEEEAQDEEDEDEEEEDEVKVVITM